MQQQPATRAPRGKFVVLHSKCRARRCARIGAKRSAKLIARLEHANLCRFPVRGDGGDNDGEDLPYVSLAEIAESGSCTEAHTSALIRQILIALDYLHQQGIVHGALRSENIFIEADSGLIKLALELLTPIISSDCDTGECNSSKTDESTSCLPTLDLWAVGCIARQLLTGYPPHSYCPSQSAFLSRLCGSSAIPQGLSLSAAAFLAECFSEVDVASSHELLHHPFMQFPLACTITGEDDDDPALRIDDQLLLAEEVRTRPPTRRPPSVPSLKLSAPLLFFSPSQTERSPTTAASLTHPSPPADCCGRRVSHSASPPAAASPDRHVPRECGISRILFAADEPRRHFCGSPPAPDARKRKAPAGPPRGGSAPPALRLAKVPGRACAPLPPWPLVAVRAVDPPRAA
jgi:serine/threonine protein kinase